jgi:hypothetical protein
MVDRAFRRMLATRILSVIAGGFVLGAFGIAGVYDLTRDHSNRAGKIRNEEDDRVKVFAVSQADSSNPEYEGYVRFGYKGRDFYDQGFDGDPDLISFYRANDKGQWNWVELTPDMPAFKDHLPLYFEARERATDGTRAQTE